MTDPTTLRPSARVEVDGHHEVRARQGYRATSSK